MVAFAAAYTVDEVSKWAAWLNFTAEVVQTNGFPTIFGIELTSGDLAFGGVVFIFYHPRNVVFAHESPGFKNQDGFIILINSHLGIGGFALVFVTEPASDTPDTLGHGSTLNGPTGDIHFMDTLIARVAITGFPEPVPVIMNQITMVGLFCSRPQPEIKVQTFGRRARCFIADTPPWLAAVPLANQ